MTRMLMSSRRRADHDVELVIRECHSMVAENRSFHERARMAVSGFLSGDAVRPTAILIVEDDPSDGKLYSEILRPLGRVVLASNGRQAMLCLGCRPFDLAVVDSTLHGGMSGPEVIARIRAGEAVRPRMPVIAVSAAMDDPDVRRASLLAGANDVMRKTGDVRELPNVARALIAEWRGSPDGDH